VKYKNVNQRLFENAILKCNPMVRFVHILPKFGLKQPSSFYTVRSDRDAF